MLIKVGQHSHMLSLMQEGYLFMNHINYFFDIGTENPRHDSIEGSTDMLQPNQVTMTKRVKKSRT